LALTLQRGTSMSRDEQEDLLGRLATNARKLDRILTNLLDLERLVRGVTEPVMESTDLGWLISSVVAEADFLTGRQVNLDLDPVEAEIDRGKLERVLENLLVNAARHTPRHCQLWIQLRSNDGQALIAVEDDGPGIP